MEKELVKVIAGIEAAGMKPEDSPKVKELRERCRHFRPIKGGQVFNLFRGQGVDFHPHGGQFQTGDFLVDGRRHRINLLFQAGVMLHDIFRGQGLVGEAHVHHGGGVAFRRGQVHQSPFCQQVEAVAVFQGTFFHRISNLPTAAAAAL